ncbi:MAG: hypothetical protein JZU67_03095, partial [Burkholderiaceae bacterium]|nr:hypothetical protein [Burkholderiaceae bacterium]
ILLMLAGMDYLTLTIKGVLMKDIFPLFVVAIMALGLLASLIISESSDPPPSITWAKIPGPLPWLTCVKQVGADGGVVCVDDYNSAS